METLRIAILTETLPPARVGLQPWRYLGDLAHAIRGEGHDVSVVTSESGMKDWNGVPVDADASQDSFRSGRGLQEIVRAKRLDGGLFRLTAGLFFSMREAPLARLEGRLVGVFLRAVHNGPDLMTRFLDPVMAPELHLDLHHAALFTSRKLGTWPGSIPYVNRYVFLWDSDRQTAVSAGLPPTASSVIRHPFDPAFLAAERAPLGPLLAGVLAPVPRRIVFAGPPEPSRGAGDLLGALDLLPRDRPTQVVLLLRDPDSRDLRVTRTRSGPHETVTVRGFVSREEIRAVYQRSHVAVFPYRFVRTALPLVILEAAAAGLPVVTTRVHPVRELEGRTGLIFTEPRSPRSLAAAIESVFQGEQAAEHERQNREWIEAAPGWDEVASSYVSAFRS